jgi:ribosomal protein L37E
MEILLLLLFILVAWFVGNDYINFTRKPCLHCGNPTAFKYKGDKLMRECTHCGFTDDLYK